MAESENFQEQYKNLIPEELNQELGRLYDMVPSILKGGLPRFLRVKAKAYEHDWDPFLKKESELKPIAMKRLESLLVYSPTTKSFKEFVVGQFDDAFEVGIPDKDSTIWFAPLRDLLDVDKVSSGGIFDPNRVEEYERIAYKSRKDIYLMTLKGTRLDDQELKVLTGDIGRWRQEFIDRYGEEP